MEYGLIRSSGKGYGEVYFLSPKLENNYSIVEDMEKKLRMVFKSPMVYRKILERTYEGIIILDEHKYIIFINKSAQDITRSSFEEMIGEDIEKILGSDIKKYLTEVQTKDEFLEKHMDLVDSSGDKISLAISFDSIGDENKCFSVILRDITEEKKNREILDAVMDNSEHSIAYSDLNFDLVCVNSEYSKMTEYPSKEKIIGKNHFDLFPTPDGSEIFDINFDTVDGCTIKDKYQIKCFENDLIWTLKPVKNKDNGIKGFIISSDQNDGLDQFDL